jgi:dipeptidase E
MKFLLTSAGLTTPEITGALADLVGKPFTETKVLFITTAANTGHDDKRWLLENLNQFDRAGVASLDVLDLAGLPKDIWEPHVLAADVICIGGGDERYLARVFAEQGWSLSLPELLKDKVYMGISAGSMVVGQDLGSKLVSEIFPEENFGDDSGAYLGLLPLAFVPHLNSSFFSIRKERLDSLAARFTAPVYAADDVTALMIENEVVKVVGETCLQYGS